MVKLIHQKPLSFQYFALANEGQCHFIPSCGVFQIGTVSGQLDHNLMVTNDLRNFTLYVLSNHSTITCCYPIKTSFLSNIYSKVRLSFISQFSHINVGF